MGKELSFDRRVPVEPIKRKPNTHQALQLAEMIEWFGEPSIQIKGSTKEGRTVFEPSKALLLPPFSTHPAIAELFREYQSHVSQLSNAHVELKPCGFQAQIIFEMFMKGIRLQEIAAQLVQEGFEYYGEPVQGDVEILMPGIYLMPGTVEAKALDCGAIGILNYTTWRPPREQDVIGLQRITYAREHPQSGYHSYTIDLPDGTDRSPKIR